ATRWTGPARTLPAPLPPPPHTPDRRSRLTPGGRARHRARAAAGARRTSPVAPRAPRPDPARAAPRSPVSDRRDKSSPAAPPTAPPPDARRHGHSADPPTAPLPPIARPPPPSGPTESAPGSSLASPASSRCHRPTGARPGLPPSGTAGSFVSARVLLAWVVSSGRSGNPWRDSHSCTAAPPAFQLRLGLTPVSRRSVPPGLQRGATPFESRELDPQGVYRSTHDEEHPPNHPTLSLTL